MLDTAAALYAVTMEGEELSLVPYAVVYRFFFISLVTWPKLFATFEQLAQHPDERGKLERAGRNEARRTSLDIILVSFLVTIMMAVGSYGRVQAARGAPPASGRRSPGPARTDGDATAAGESVFFEHVRTLDVADAGLGARRE